MCFVFLFFRGGGGISRVFGEGFALDDGFSLWPYLLGWSVGPGPSAKNPQISHPSLTSLFGSIGMEFLNRSLTILWVVYHQELLKTTLKTTSQRGTGVGERVLSPTDQIASSSEA